MAPRLRSFDVGHDETFAQFLYRQREKLQRRQDVEIKKGPGWWVTSRGVRPSQIHLEGEPTRQARTEFAPDR